MLAAGGGARLWPLTCERPKALCPVAGVPLVDLALDRLAEVGLSGPADVAANAHHHAAAMAAHLGERVHVSIEEELLGTGGAVGRLRTWIAGRAVVVVNADALHDAPLDLLLAGWDGRVVRFLVASEEAPAHLDRSISLCATLLPWAAVRDVPDERCSISERVWDPWTAAGATEVVAVATPFYDCGTPASYLAANLWRSGGETVVGAGAFVAGRAERCVLWPGARVREGEVLRDAIRTSAGRTVLVRSL